MINNNEFTDCNRNDNTINCCSEISDLTSELSVESRPETQSKRDMKGWRRVKPLISKDNFHSVKEDIKFYRRV